MASDNATFPGLLGDWGRVLTSDVFASFGAFCELEGLEPDATSRVFGNDAECRDSCRTPGVRRATRGRVSRTVRRGRDLRRGRAAQASPGHLCAKAPNASGSSRSTACSSTTSGSIGLRRRSLGWRRPSPRRGRDDRAARAVVWREPSIGRVAIEAALSALGEGDQLGSSAC